MPVHRAVTFQNRFLIGTLAKQDFRSCRLSLEGLLALGELPAERRREPRLTLIRQSKPPVFGTRHSEAETRFGSTAGGSLLTRVFGMLGGLDHPARMCGLTFVEC